MRPVQRNIKAARPLYSPPKGIGFFMNLLSKINKWIERQNKKGGDIPRFTKVQIRKIALYLENHYMFNFNALRKGKGRHGPRGLVKGMTAEASTASARYGPGARELGVLEPDTGPAPLRGRANPTWDDQLREFKRIVKEENKKIPVDVLDELLL